MIVELKICTALSPGGGRVTVMCRLQMITFINPTREATEKQKGFAGALHKMSLSKIALSAGRSSLSNRKPPCPTGRVCVCVCVYARVCVHARVCVRRMWTVVKSCF